MSASTKAQAERELEEAWEEQKAVVDSFSPDELERPGVVGHWSMKDLVGHVAFWTEQATENLRLVTLGKGEEIRRPGDERTTAAWNERERQFREHRPLAAIREEWLKSFEEVRQALRDLRPERLEQEVGGRRVLELFAEDTYEHYREHLEDMRAWRRQLDALGR